ncbi:MAG: N-acetylmuramoyl-L-alanine amidase [Pseudomonadota bacterium]
MTGFVALCGLFLTALPGPASGSDALPEPRLVSVTIAEEGAHLRLALAIEPAAETEAEVTAGPGQVIVTLPDLRAEATLALPEGLSLTIDEESATRLVLEAPDRAGSDGILSARRQDARPGETLVFAVGQAAMIAMLPARVPLPTARPQDFAALVAAREVDWPQPFTVVIDPGHGGHDPGAMVDGIVEKDFALVFSRRLALRIGSIEGMRAVLTREGDRFLPLGARLRKAVAEGADAFVSIHADTEASGTASGLSIYTLTEEDRLRAAEEVTSTAPRDSILRGVSLAGASDDVTRILVDLSQRRAGGQAEELASVILGDLGPDVPVLLTRPHRNANFRVLRSVDFPAILIELGFLSNIDDRERLTDRRWQMETAERITLAIDAWRRGTATSPAQ